MNKALVLFSGGIDSTICLALAINKYGKENVETISINYGQKNIRELESSCNICKYYDIKNKIIDLNSIFKEFNNCSLLKNSTKEVPYTSYDEQYESLKENENVSTNVPFRNGLMLSVCASYAIAYEFNEVYYGIHLEDGIARKLYPDCDEDFNLSMNLAIYIGSGKKVKITAPLSGLLKKDVIKLGNELNIPFQLTWTCYEKGLKACGKCCACKDRIKGFSLNNLIDPIEYCEV